MSLRSMLSRFTALNRRRLQSRRSRERLAWSAADEAGVPASLVAASPYDDLRLRDRPSIHFEAELPALAVTPTTLSLCFYLPQFHAIDENDRWWGPGFTEWRNVARGMPRFAGHYQPRIPRDLGFYDLSDVSVMRRQARLARGAGITGFSFYYYNFSGQRLLERPIEQFLSTPDIDLGFCLTWANENWTRRWDGQDQDVLAAQRHSPDDIDALAIDVCRHFADPRYIRVAGGRPLFVIYRMQLLPDPAAWLARFRRVCIDRIGVDPWIAMVQTREYDDPRACGADGGLEFPPHKMTDRIEPIWPAQIHDPDFIGTYYRYEDLVQAGTDQPDPPYPLIKCVAPNWDNEARKPGKGTGFVGSTPALFERWLDLALAYARRRPIDDTPPLIFINAWNEWAEGTYLEPDVHHGHAYLNAVRRALSR